MVRIETKNESLDSFDIEIHVEGNGIIVVHQITIALDELYKAVPNLFEKALLLSQYTKDHT